MFPFQTSCKDAIIWPIEAFICPKLNVEGLCDVSHFYQTDRNVIFQAVERKVQSMNICKNQLEDSHVDPTIEKDITDVMELTDQLEDNSNIELHSVRVETPRVAIEYRLSDLKIKIRAANIYFKVSWLTKMTNLSIFAEPCRSIQTDISSILHLFRLYNFP